MKSFEGDSDVPLAKDIAYGSLEFRIQKWADYSSTVHDLTQQYAVCRREAEGHRPAFEKGAQVLFRGQSSERWELLTTLERRSLRRKERWTMSGYHEMATAYLHEIASATGATWDVEAPPDKDSKPPPSPPQYSAVDIIPRMQSYNYLTYLRHHGFPSPLLDWSSSPFVAAFFAYEDHSTDDDPCVYMFVERPGLVKLMDSWSPTITVKGHFTHAHRRHFVQKSWYTIATKPVGGGADHEFVQHDRVVQRTTPENAPIGLVQDRLVKIVLPRADRSLALKDLDQHNLNRYTLFLSEDALIKSIESRVFDH